MKERILKKLNNPIYALFGVIALLTAVAGSAYAYYQATASNSTTVTGAAAGPGTLSLNVTQLSTSATGNLIPMDTDLTILNQAALGYGNSSGYNATKQCIDKYGYTVCKVYQISITNTGTTSTIITGGVTSLSGANTPNLTCTVMSDNHTVSTIKNCVGNNTLAKKVTLAANATNTYYVMVYINNINGVQADSGTFNGTIEFNTGEGGIKASFYPSAEEKITNLFSKTGTVTEDSTGAAISLDVDTTHKLMKDPNGNIRYYGASPSNYVYFNCEEYPSTNCETWRIIGVVDGRLKIMRSSSIGGLSWDTSTNDTAGNSGYGINQWGPSVFTGGGAYSGADLMKLLNPGYSSNQDLNNSGTTVTVNNSLYYNSGSGTCYTGRYNATSSCDFTSTGLKNDATRNKIASDSYPVGGVDSNAVYPNVLLQGERSDGVGTNTNDLVVRTAVWTGSVMVPYPSDYAYAADLSLCTVAVNAYDNSDCTSNNWMKTVFAGNAWLLIPRSGHGYHNWVVRSNGLVARDYGPCNGYPVFPTVYLKLDTVIESGSGTSADPYKLS